MPELDVPVLLMLAAAAFVAGGVDAIAGGGGLITLPVLLLAGLPPHVALGTNKGQSVFGAAAALIRYSHAGLVDRGRAMLTLPAGLVGASLGAWLVTYLDPSVLRPVILVLLVGAGLVVALRRSSLSAGGQLPAFARLIAVAIAFAIGTYDGFFGPGTGTFLLIAFTLLLQLPVPQATADAKVVNFASNLAAVALFSARGLVVWHIALPMAAAQFAGASLGAHLAVRGGASLIRRVVLVVVSLLVLKLGADLFGN